MRIANRTYPDMQITCLASDGEVTVWIKGKWYFYHGVDTALYPEITRLEKKAPWRALSIIKNSATSFDRG